MLTKKLNGAKLEIYDNADMPVENYINYSRLVMLDAGIGSDPMSVMQHITMLQRYVAKGDMESLAKELNNYHQSLIFTVSNVSPRMMSFAALLYKVDGKQVEDFSDENLQGIIERLSRKGLTVRIVEEVLDFVKKKLTPSLRPTK